MADVLQTTSLLILAQNYAGDLVRQINRRSVLLQMLAKEPDEGKNVAWAPEKSGALAESFTEGADAANFGSDGQASAILPWSMYRSNFHVSGLAQATSRTSRTPVGNIDLWARNMVNSAAALATKINADLYAGAGAPDLVGLGEAIGSVSNTYATIDRTTNAYWRPYVVAPGVDTAITFDQIRTDMAEIYKQCGERPNVGFCSPAVYKTVAGLFDPQKLYLMETAAQSKIQLEGGSQMLKFDGLYLIEDKDATEKQIFYINTDHLQVKYLPIGEQGMGMGDESLDMDINDGVMELPLGLRMEMLAKNGDSDRAQMKVYLQLKCDRPNSCGVRKDISIG